MGRRYLWPLARVYGQLVRGFGVKSGAGMLTGVLPLEAAADCVNGCSRSFTANGLVLDTASDANFATCEAASESVMLVPASATIGNTIRSASISFSSFLISSSLARSRARKDS